MKPRLPCLCLILLIVFGTGSTLFAQPNAVGYHNKTLVPGFNLISNPLFNPGSHLSNVINGIQTPIPDGLTFFFLEANGFRAATYDAIDGAFIPPFAGGESIHPGRGFFVFNPATNNLTVTFVGEVLQGSLTNSLHAGFSIVAAMVPQEATLETLNFPAEQGDIVFLWDELNQRYQPSSYDDIDGAWLPPVRPLRVGEAFLLYKLRPTLWIRYFDILNP